MKRRAPQKSLLQTIGSLAALAAFIYLGLASGGVSQQKFDLGGGRWEMARHLGNGTTQIIRGPVDKKGLFDGPVKIDYEDDNYILIKQEEVTMKGGERHGLSKMTNLKTKEVTEVCYQYGKRVEKKYCEQTTEKAAWTLAENNSAYSLFSYKAPWYEFCLDACGYDSEYMKAYLDTLELVLYASEFALEEFDDYYDEAIGILEETPYDSIISLNNEFSIFHGIDLIMRHEFRLATLDAYMEGDSNTFVMIQTTYPNYLLQLNQLELTDAEFEDFCHEYDSIMSSYDPISPGDPYLLDSLDQRMIRTMDQISSEEDTTALKSWVLKHALASTDNRISIRSLQKEYLSRELNHTTGKTPREVSELVLMTILASFLEGDLVKNAVKDAYAIEKEITTLPTVITVFSAENSSTSVAIEGHVIEDGGGEVTARGLAWESFYNPSIDNQVVPGGTGIGVFTVSLSGLEEGKTYYARAFATNSAGTAYGNCISFVTGASTGIGSEECCAINLDMYPNPATDFIHIRFEGTDSKSLVFSIYDLGGKVVLQEKLEQVVPGMNTHSFEVSELKSGYYTCILESNNFTLSRKRLVIIR